MYFLKKLKLFELKPKLISKNNKGILSHQIINVNFFSVYINDLVVFNKIKKLKNDNACEDNCSIFFNSLLAVFFKILFCFSSSVILLF